MVRVLPLSKINYTLNSSYCLLKSQSNLKDLFKILLHITLSSIPTLYSPSTLVGPISSLPQKHAPVHSPLDTFFSHIWTFPRKPCLCFQSRYILPTFKSLFQGTFTTSYTGKPTGIGVKTQYFNLSFLLPGYSLLGFFVLFFCLFWPRWVFVAARRLSLAAASRGVLFVVVRGLLVAVAPLLLWSTGFRCAGFSSRSTRALEHRLSSCGAWV